MQIFDLQFSALEIIVAPSGVRIRGITEPFQLFVETRTLIQRSANADGYDVTRLIKGFTKRGWQHGSVKQCSDKISNRRGSYKRNEKERSRLYTVIA